MKLPGKNNKKRSSAGSVKFGMAERTELGFFIYFYPYQVVALRTG